MKRGLVTTATIWVLSLGSVAHAQVGDPDAGRDVFEVNCAMCHGQDAGGMMGMHPSLRGAVERLSLEGVEVTIRNGRRTDPPMPAFEDRLGDQEMRDVIAYLDTLPVGPRNFGLDDGGMMGGDMGEMMGGGMWSMFAWAVLFLIAIAAVAIASVFVVRAMSSRGRAGGASPSNAIEILDERYARGEIDREEFEERRRGLGK